MAYRAVIFDLFGTLVKGFNRQDYDPVIARMAETFDIPCVKISGIRAQRRTLPEVWDTTIPFKPI